MSDLRILIVDDEAGLREGIQRSLRGYERFVEEVDEAFHLSMESAVSGEQALEKMAATPFDLMLLDNKLPGIQGLDLLDRLQQMQSETVVIMVTAYASIEAAVSATKRGAFDFLAKPFTPKELRLTLDKAVRHVVLQRHAKRMIEEKRRARFDLISIVSHELKAPLSALDGYLYILKEPDHLDAATYGRCVERCSRRVDEMRKLIVDFLDLTRIESGQKQRVVERIDICELLSVRMDSIREEASRRRIDLRTQLSEPELWIDADPDDIEIVLNNLLGNAVKYNREGGTITAQAGLSDGSLVIRISDTGIGMTEKEMGKLFREFSRIRNEKTRDIPGSGLGLAIVKRIADMNGGRIEVDSQPNVATTFTFSLPMQSKI